MHADNKLQKYYSALLINYHLLPLSNFLPLSSAYHLWSFLFLTLFLSLSLSRSFACSVYRSFSLHFRPPSFLQSAPSSSPSHVSPSLSSTLPTPQRHFSARFSLTPFPSIPSLSRPPFALCLKWQCENFVAQNPSPDEAFPRSLGRWRAGADAERRTARGSEWEGPYVSCQECPSGSNPPPEGQRRRRAAVIDACILGLSTINIYVLSRDALVQKRNAAEWTEALPLLSMTGYLAIPQNAIFLLLRTSLIIRIFLTFNLPLWHLWFLWRIRVVE